MESEETLLLREAIELLEKVAELLADEGLDGKLCNEIVNFLDENS